MTVPPVPPVLPGAPIRPASTAPQEGASPSGPSSPSAAAPTAGLGTLEADVGAELEADVAATVRGLDDSSTSDHAEVFERVHARLQEALARTDSR